MPHFRKRRLTARKTRRGISRVRGRGAYYNDFGTVLGGIGGGIAGGFLGGPVGAWTGAGAGMTGGGAIGGLIDTVSGHGAYRVSQNSLTKLREGQPVPSFGSLSQGTRIRHREFIQDITAVGGTTFTNISFTINPGLVSSFPWLAGIASQFDTYQIKGMIYEFVSTSSATATGLALGSVIMASDYDDADNDFGTKLEMENSQYAVSAKPSVSQYHIIECDPKVTQSKMLFTRSGVVPANKDSRFYDYGSFQIATAGLPVSTGTLGELWVTYDIEFYKPQMNSSALLRADHFKISTAASTSQYLGPDTTTVVSPTTTSTLGGTCTKSTYTFPSTVASGQYYVTLVYVGASSPLGTAMSCTVVNGSIANNYWQNNTFNIARQTAGVTADQQFHQFVVKVTGSGCTLTWTAGTLPGTLTSADLIIASFSHEVVN